MVEHFTLESIDNAESDEEYPSKSPPSVVYTKKSLNSQYGRMERVKDDIQHVNFRLKTQKH